MGDARIVQAKQDYESKKYEAKTTIERELNAHNERVMCEIGTNGDSKALYRHMGSGSGSGSLISRIL